MAKMKPNQRVKRYHKFKILFFFLTFFAVVLFFFLFLLTESAALLQSKSASVSSNFWIQLFLYTTVLSVLVGAVKLPFQLGGDYLLEKRYGLSNLTFRGWCVREVKKGLLSFLFFLLLVETGYFFLRSLGENWWLAFALMWIFYQWILLQLFPVWIVPLFFRYEPVKDEALIGLLRRFAEKQGRSIDSVRMLNLSKESKRANAAVLGIGKKKRIILGDTLLERFNHDEIKVIFAHELGHDKQHHMVYSFLFNALLTFGSLYIIQGALQKLLSVFHLSHPEDLAALPLFLLLFSLVGFCLLSLQNGFSRFLEREADGFALRTTGMKEAFISSMRKLASQNLADPSPNRLVEIFFHTHPPISKRIRFAEEGG